MITAGLDKATSNTRLPSIRRPANLGGTLFVGSGKYISRKRIDIISDVSDLKCRDKVPL